MSKEVKTHVRALLKLSVFLCLSTAALLLSSCAGGGDYYGGAGNFHTVIVDAGHGGHDRGAKAVSGQPEKVLALDTAQRLARILRSKGFRVIETRRGDYFVPLPTRAAASNRESGAIFVSVHYNWVRRSAPRGIETYYYTPRSRRLAANILREVRQAYPTSNRGVKRNNYHVLRNNKRPAVLLELGFLSNPADNSYLQNPRVRQKLAEEIADGIIAEKRGRNP